MTEGLRFRVGAGEMAERVRTYDWAATPLGPVETWPQSLTTAIRIVLSSRYAMWMAWGPELTFFCNDAYLPTVGIKRDWVLGARSDVVWQEIWPDIGPRVEHVLTTGQASWEEGLLLYLERSGFREETYHTFSYSPLADDAGSVVGMLCVVTEETERVIGERRLRALRDLGLQMTQARTATEVWQAVERSILAEVHDFPFALGYASDPEGDFRLALRANLPPGHAAAPAIIAAGSSGQWPVREVLDRASPMLMPIVGDLSVGSRDEAPTQAFVVPIATGSGQGPTGALVVGLNPSRPFDTAYRGFVELLVGQAASALAKAGAYEAERRRAEALAEIDRAKTSFFSNVSHEFRTPLTLMLGPLEDVLSGGGSGLSAGEHQSIEAAHRNGLRLLRLVNDLLDFSRIEAGRAQARFEPVELGLYTAELASSFRSATERAGLALRIDCPTGTGPVHVDRMMWEKIVLNLVSNAFKFTFEGEIDVSLRREKHEVLLQVRDTGTGIAPEELPRLFERFHRVEGARGRSFEGSGIGLALVQELVSVHQGRITVESEPGRGTTFTVAVPLGADHLPAAAPAAPGADAHRMSGAQAFVAEALRWLPEPPSDAPPSDAPPSDAPPSDVPPAAATIIPAPGETTGRVVLADDNADLRNYIARLLTEQGYRVEALADGEQALEAVRRQRPDIVLTDVMMPNLDGIGLLQAIRCDAVLRDLPVIMLSARAGEEARIDGIAAGADDYLTKPFSARELLARVGANIATARLRREAIIALEESEARFRNMAEHTPVMMWVTDARGACVYLNQAWYAFTGQSSDTPFAEGWLTALYPDDISRAKQSFFAASAERAPFQMEYRLLGADAAPRWVVAAAAPRLDAGGGFLGYVGSVVDIHERVEAEATLERRVAAEIAARAQAEDALRQSQKMEAVGQLTGGLAHDFNNLLTGITGSLELLSNRLGQGRLNDLPRYITAAQGAAKRAASLTHRLLAFSRRQTLDPQPTNVNRLVAEMEELIRRTVGPSVDIGVVGGVGLWTTIIDPGQLENALLNLCINARDAMPNGGRITVETANRWLDERSAMERELAEGQYISLCVSDTGTGMTPDIVARAFDPFFTTKPIGQGTGLGLSMIYGFARQSGGQVRIYSEIGIGTTVCLYLPRHYGAESAQPRQELAEPAPAVSGETVLVVDDEPTVRMLLTDVLEDLGYRAIEAVDGPSGLRILESDVRIDLLVTDVGLPGGINGRQLADAARALRSGLKVLFITGYAENAVMANGHLEAGMHVLTKPFSIDVLLRRIKTILV